jgi:putative transposase
LTEVERHAARYGRADAAQRFAQPIHRDKTSIGPLEWVSLDGRTQDFWADRGDGRPIRLTMLMLVDVATNMVLDVELASSENATDTVRLIKRVCETYGIFDRLYTDNGSAFAEHLVAGGNVHRFRNSGSNTTIQQPPEICKNVGIDPHFALPGNGQAEIAERTFAALSRVIDDRPEFKGAHAGHSPGASPDIKVVPVPFNEAQRVIRREIDRHNREAGRRGQGALGRSYKQMFRDELANRIRHQPTARQLYLSSLMYKPVSVDRSGQVKVNGWIYGSPATQVTLLDYHGKDQKILLGRDPDDFNAPAIAFDLDGNLICEGIEPVHLGAYGSVKGIWDAARNRKAARTAVAVAEAANDYLTDTIFRPLLPHWLPRKPRQRVRTNGSPRATLERHSTTTDWRR